MTVKIVHKNSTVSGKIPTAAQLDRGEIAINLADKALYTKDQTDTVVALAKAGDADPQHAGPQAVPGTSSYFAREDHVHPQEEVITLAVNPSGAASPVDPRSGDPFDRLTSANTWIKDNISSATVVIHVAAGTYNEDALLFSEASKNTIKILGANQATTKLVFSGNNGLRLENTASGRHEIKKVTLESTAAVFPTLLTVQGSELFAAAFVVKGVISVFTNATLKAGGAGIHVDIPQGSNIVGSECIRLDSLSTLTTSASGSININFDNHSKYAINCDSARIILASRAALINTSGNGCNRIYLQDCFACNVQPSQLTGGAVILGVAIPTAGASGSLPLPPGAATAGTSRFYAREDHVHPPAPSDRKLKDQIQPLDPTAALAMVEQLKPSQFSWIKPEYQGQPTIGLIAQDVAQVIPSLVATSTVPAVPEQPQWDEDGIPMNPIPAVPEYSEMSVHYAQLTAVLAAAVQELSARVKALEAAP